MNSNKQLILIKILHTLIWLFFVAIIFYVVYSGLSGNVNLFTWIAIALVFLEGLTLLVFKMFAP